MVFVFNNLNFALSFNLEVIPFYTIIQIFNYNHESIIFVTANTNCFFKK